MPFRHCQKICRHVNAGTQPHCEHTPWMSLFLRSGWLDFRRNPSNHVAGKWKIFPVENAHKLSGCRKEHADHFPVENGSNFPVESENFPDTPMETLVMHPANTEDARNGAGQSQTRRVLETPNTLCNRNMSFLLLGFLANFPEYFPEKRVMRNGFFFSENTPSGRLVPIWSVFFRFIPICFEIESEQIRATPLCRPLLQIPDHYPLVQNQYINHSSKTFPV